MVVKSYTVAVVDGKAIFNCFWFSLVVLMMLLLSLLETDMYLASMANATFSVSKLASTTVLV